MFCLFHWAPGAQIQRPMHVRVVLLASTGIPGRPGFEVRSQLIFGNLDFR